MAFIIDLLDILENYGWFILLGIFLALYIYKRFIKLSLQSIQERKELERQKKFDSKIKAFYEEHIRAARERAQQKLEIKVAEASERLETKKRKQLNEIMKQDDFSGEHFAKASSEMQPASTDSYSFVKNLIDAIPVVVFSKSYCPYCRNAKRALSTYRMSDNVYKIIELDGREDCDKIQDVLLQMTGARSVPRVFIGGECVGGCDDVHAAQKEGRLEEMLRKAGAV